MNVNQTNQNEQWTVLVLLLKEIAEIKGITHTTIAEKTGFHRSNVSRFFSLKHRPDLHIFLEIAKAIEVDFFISKL
ncbi:MAG: helix-turn-helix domain-containing protein [Ferruginibacter sp.]|nr:helix-turn-helix domain-containing protein [Ferruginibacter sp.]